jgi:hypothetical protein
MGWKGIGYNLIIVYKQNKIRIVITYITIHKKEFLRCIQARFGMLYKVP